MEIADDTAIKANYGRVTAERFEATQFIYQGRAAWAVGRNTLVMGSTFYVVIDAETGNVLLIHHQGLR